MALSQIQCLNEYHVNLRTNESKPEFLYSEEQRLALEKLLDEGPDTFQKFIKDNRIRPFLSDLELAQLSNAVEPYCPDLPASSAGLDGDPTGTRLSLQYWPERSDDSLPELDLGWPQRASYRGVTRVTVHAQPPLDGGAHIKEVIRRTIARAQKVIAVVMDVFTDVDIFKDLLHASFKRNVAVYIILDDMGVPHFLKMCENVSMHTGHLKNLRVRSIRGTGFFTRSSKKVCGSQCQKFMFVDGDKAVSGSYSFTWTASRLDRSIITVLTGQGVDLFDKLFQDLYILSDAVDINKINLETEQKPEPISKAAPPLQTSTTMALKLINPKYALVSNAASNIHMVSQMFPANSNNIKQVKEDLERPNIHPGLLHLEKANMIDYLPIWPEPDPPSDVIGFINIRDCNRPLQAHLTRSELFEVTQAIRFKDPIQIPQESLPKKVCPSPTSQNSSLCNHPEQIFPPHILKDQDVCLPPVLNPNPAHSSGNSPVDDGVENQTDVPSKQRENVDAENICTSFEPLEDSQISENPLIENITPSDSVKCNTIKTHTPVVQLVTASDKQCCENITETTGTKDFQDIQWNTQKLLTHTYKTYHADTTGHNGNSIYSDSRASFSSEEYFECRENVDSESVGMVNRTPAVSTAPDEPNNATESLSSLISGSCNNALSHEAIEETEESELQCALLEEHLTGLTADLELTMSANKVKDLSESVSTANEHETDSTSQQGKESELLRQVKTDTHTAPDKNAQCLQECESYSVVNHMSDTQPIEKNSSPESVNKSLLQDHIAAPHTPVLKTAKEQCIVFSQEPQLRLNPEIYSGFSYTSNLKSVPVDTTLTPLSKPASLNTGTESGHEEDCKMPFQMKPLFAEKSTNEEAKDINKSSSETKKSPAAQTVDKQRNQKKPTGFKVVRLSVDIYSLKRKTLDHLCVQQERKKQPEVKSNVERNTRKLHRLSPQPKPIPIPEAKLSSTKASVTKLHSSHHPTTPAVSTPGVQNDLPARQSAQNRASNDHSATPAKLSRRHTVPIRSNQTRLRALRTEPSADPHHSSQKQPQTQQDTVRFNQLHRSSFRQRSASTTEGRSSFRGTLFQKTSKSPLKERSTESSSQTNLKKTIKSIK